MKAALLIVIIYVIYRQLFVNNDITSLKAEFLDNISEGNVLFLLIAIVLMPVNWLLETLKWHTLVSSFQKLNVKKAFQSILGGVTLAIVTPARIGEYGGRLMYIPSGKRSKAILATFIGSIMQNIVNVSIGLLGLGFFQKYYGLLNLEEYSFLIILILFALLTIFILWYFRHAIFTKLRNIKVVKSVLNQLEFSANIGMLDTRNVTIVSGLSLSRYTVYTVQYLMLILFYGVTDDIIGALMGISLIFLVQTLLPLPPVLSIFARGEVALIIFGVLTDNMIGIISATFTLWIINLVIPALIGYYYIWKMQPQSLEE